jgi:hypothetical protein
MLQDELAAKYKYKKLPIDISINARNEYLTSLPECLNVNGDVEFKLYSKSGTLISSGYNRIVIGDYGAFIEFDLKQVVKKNLKIKKGQEYRIKDEKYKNNVKYIWLTAKDESDIKVYFQRKTVVYADYIPNVFYVSPFEIMV